MKKTIRRKLGQIAACMMVAGLFVSLAPHAQRAHADASVNAVFTGTATATAAFVPANLNPNVQLYPGYSFSELFNDSTHSLSGGVYPGFLVDAAAQFYGYGDEARSTLGIAESQWPNPPQKSSAGLTDFGDKCRFLETDLYFPHSFVDTCNSYWAEWGDNFPVHLATAASVSNATSTSGEAHGGWFMLPAGVKVGGFESSTSTKLAPDGKSVISTANASLSNIEIGSIIHIDHIYSTATSVANGSIGGAQSQRTLRIVNATVSFGPATPQPVTIDDSGVHLVSDNGVVQDLTQQLHAYGIDVRLVQGGQAIRSNETSTESGSLLVQYSATTPPQPIQTLAVPYDQLCHVTGSANDQAFSTWQATTHQGRFQLTHSVDNPLRQDNALSGVQHPLSKKYIFDKNARPWTLTQQSYSVEADAPPVVPCVDYLYTRSVNAGSAIGNTFADATFQTFPAPPPLPTPGPVFPGGKVTTSRVIYPGSAPVVGSVAQPSPAHHRRVVVASSELGEAVAHRVKIAYLVMSLLVLILLIGRNVFRNLVRL